MKRISHVAVATAVLRVAAALIIGVATPSGFAHAASGQETQGANAPSVVLGRPTDTSVTLNVLPNDAGEVRVEYGAPPGQLANQTQPSVWRKAFHRGCARRPDEKHALRLPAGVRHAGTDDFDTQPECTFHTQRAPASTFTFEIQGDSHPERPKQFDARLLPDTARRSGRSPRFLYDHRRRFQRGYSPRRDCGRGRADIPQSAPAPRTGGVFSTYLPCERQSRTGAACNLDGTSNNVAVWAQTARNRLFPQPAPDTFYTGDAEPAEFIGPLRDYYAWAWGDALFVVIDPYWHSPKPVDNVFGGGAKSRDMWAITLETPISMAQADAGGKQGEVQVRLRHHVLGTGRGGVEMADLCEWAAAAGTAAGNSARIARAGRCHPSTDVEERRHDLLPGPRPHLRKAGEGRRDLPDSARAGGPQLHTL